MQNTRLIFIAPPGAGKGTQAELLQKRLGFRTLSTGDIFRKEISESSDLGIHAKSYIENGVLVPDNVTFKMIRKYIEQDEIKNNHFILDGFPRTIKQAELLETFLNELQIPLTAALLLEVPFEALIRRLSGRLICSKCGTTYHNETKIPKNFDKCDKCLSPLIMRDDDKPEAVNRRLEVYKNQTKPLIDYFQNLNLLKMVNADQNFEKVYLDIIKILNLS